MKLHPSEFDKNWIIKNLDEIEHAIEQDSFDYAIGKIDGIRDHLDRTKYITVKALKKDLETLNEDLLDVLTDLFIDLRDEDGMTIEEAHNFINIHILNVVNQFKSKR
jgi:hypothetical protein